MRMKPFFAVPRGTPHSFAMWAPKAKDAGHGFAHGILSFVRDKLALYPAAYAAHIEIYVGHQDGEPLGQNQISELTA